MSQNLVMFNGVNLRTAGGLVSVAVRPASVSSPSDLAEQDVPRRQGSVVQYARKKSRVITFTGAVGGDFTRDQIIAALDAINAATSPETGPQPLYAGSDDRFWLAQRESYTVSWDQGLLFGVMADISISFRAADADAYGSTGLSGSPALTAVLETIALGTSGVTNATPVGDSTAQPVWSLTISAAATGSIALANALTGETATIAGTFATGDVITLDARDATYGAYLNGTIDYGIFSGPIPRLWPGVNPISLTPATLALSAAAATYNPRYC